MADREIPANLLTFVSLRWLTTWNWALSDQDGSEDAQVLSDWFSEHEISLDYADYEGYPAVPTYLSLAWSWGIHLSLLRDPMNFRMRKFLSYLEHQACLPDPPLG